MLGIILRCLKPTWIYLLAATLLLGLIYDDIALRLKLANKRVELATCENSVNLQNEAAINMQRFQDSQKKHYETVDNLSQSYRDTAYQDKSKYDIPSDCENAIQKGTEIINKRGD